MNESIINWIKNIIEDYNETALNKISPESLIDMLKINKVWTESIDNVLWGLNRRELAKLLNYLLWVNKDEVKVLLNFSDVFYFIDQSHKNIPQEVRSAFIVIWSANKKIYQIMRSCSCIWEIYYYEIDKEPIQEEPKDDYVKLIDWLYYSLNNNSFKKEGITPYSPPRHHKWFMKILIDKRCHIFHKEITDYVYEKGEHTISWISDYKWNLLKLLRDNNLLWIKEDFIKWYDGGYILNKYIQ